MYYNKKRIVDYILDNVRYLSLYLDEIKDLRAYFMSKDRDELKHITDSIEYMKFGEWYATYYKPTTSIIVFNSTSGLYSYKG